MWWNHAKEKYNIVTTVTQTNSNILPQAQIYILFVCHVRPGMMLSLLTHASVSINCVDCFFFFLSYLLVCFLLCVCFVVQLIDFISITARFYHHTVAAVLVIFVSLCFYMRTSKISTFGNLILSWCYTVVCISGMVWSRVYVIITLSSITNSQEKKKTNGKWKCFVFQLVELVSLWPCFQVNW